MVLCYWSSLRGAFLFDDISAVVNNPTIRHFASLSVLNPPNDGSTTTGRPVVNLSFAINHAISGERVWSYHALNVATHALATLALMGIVRRTLSGAVLGKRFGRAACPLAFVIAGLWALHPLQTESVICIAQRTESLCGLFYLLTLYGFIRGAEAAARSGRWFACSAVSCLVGMGTKEVMVTAPLVVLLYDRTFLAGGFLPAWRRRRAYYLSLACTELLLAWLVLRGGGSRGAAAGFGLGVSWWAYLLRQSEAILVYLKLSFWPHPLVLDYGTAVVRSVADVWWQGLVVIALLAGTLWALWRKPVVGFVGAWFFVILAPSSSVVPLVTQTMAEHRMYLPLAGVVCLVVLAAYGRVGPVVTWLLAAVAMIGLSFATIVRNHDYLDVVALWTDTVAKCPQNARAHSYLGVALAEIPGRLPEAIAHYEEALRIMPTRADAHYDLANALAKTPGRTSDAIDHFEEALRLKPDYAEAHNNLAVALAKIPGRVSEAIAHYEAALRVKPDYAEAHNDLANELAKIPGRMPEAIAHYGEALRLKPDFPDASYNLANALATMPGRLPAAIAHYEEALRFKPDYAEVHNNLGIVLAQMPGRLPEAIAHYEAALRLKPDLAEAHSNLADALAGMPGWLADAMAHYETALRLKPDLAVAHNNLATELAQMPGRLPDAIAHFEEALRLKPDYAEARRNLGITLARMPERLSDAIARGEEAVRLGPDSVDAHANLAGVYAQTGRWEAAVEQLEIAVRLNPASSAIRDNLGKLKARRGQ